MFSSYNKVMARLVNLLLFYYVERRKASGNKECQAEPTVTIYGATSPAA